MYLPHFAIIQQPQHMVEVWADIVVFFKKQHWTHISLGGIQHVKYLVCLRTYYIYRVSPYYYVCFLSINVNYWVGLNSKFKKQLQVPMYSCSLMWLLAQSMMMMMTMTMMMIRRGWPVCNVKSLEFEITVSLCQVCTG